jgi:hypothetical protein
VSDMAGIPFLLLVELGRISSVSGRLFGLLQNPGEVVGAAVDDRHRDDAGHLVRMLPLGAIHDLRHTSATLSIVAGAGTRELMARMGHSSSAAALRYQHVMAGRDAAIAAALDQLIEAATALAESPPSAPSGTRVTRIGRPGSTRMRH